MEQAPQFYQCSLTLLISGAALLLSTLALLFARNDRKSDKKIQAASLLSQLSISYDENGTELVALLKRVERTLCETLTDTIRSKVQGHRKEVISSLEEAKKGATSLIKFRQNLENLHDHLPELILMEGDVRLTIKHCRKMTVELKSVSEEMANILKEHEDMRKNLASMSPEERKRFDAVEERLSQPTEFST
jgi:Mg2+ and Co2+ transporter CorA